MPWDGGTSSGPGRTSVPEQSSQRPDAQNVDAVQEVQVFGALSTIDFGDAPTVPGYIEDTLTSIQTLSRPVVEAGVVPRGGCRPLALARRAWAVTAVHGPLGLVPLDWHTDLWELYSGGRYSRWTMFRRAIEEGIVDPGRTMPAGMRGPLYRSLQQFPAS